MSKLRERTLEVCGVRLVMYDTNYIQPSLILYWAKAIELLLSAKMMNKRNDDNLCRSPDADAKQVMFPSRAERIIKDRDVEGREQNSLRVFLLLMLFFWQKKSFFFWTESLFVDMRIIRWKASIKLNIGHLKPLWRPRWWDGRARSGSRSWDRFSGNLHLTQFLSTLIETI